MADNGTWKIIDFGSCTRAAWLPEDSAERRHLAHTFGRSFHLTSAVVLQRRTLLRTPPWRSEPRRWWTSTASNSSTTRSTCGPLDAWSSAWPLDTSPSKVRPGFLYHAPHETPCCRGSWHTKWPLHHSSFNPALSRTYLFHQVPIS